MQRADELLTFLRKVSIISPAARASQPLTPAPDAASAAAVGLLTADRTADGKLVAKSYAVGLEISCPGGVYCWAPEIPSAKRLTGAKPSTCELVHNRGLILSKCRLWPAPSSASFILREHLGGIDQQILPDRSPRRG